MSLSPAAHDAPSVGEDADTSPAKLARRMTIAQDRL